MYAIVEIAGQQFKVAKDQKVFVHRLEEKEGSKISFDKVLLLDDGKVTIGAPVIENAVVTATVLGHLKGDKVIVFKKKRRKGFKKRNGHRQYLSQIQIESISTEAPVKKAAAKKEEAPAEIKPAVKKAAPDKKAAPAKKEAVKKEVVKKEAKAPVKAAPKAAAKKASPKK
jgi:large subunit ribosomal protein L21